MLSKATFSSNVTSSESTTISGSYQTEVTDQMSPYERPTNVQAALHALYRGRAVPHGTLYHGSYKPGWLPTADLLYPLLGLLSPEDLVCSSSAASAISWSDHFRYHVGHANTAQVVLTRES